MISVEEGLANVLTQVEGSRVKLHLSHLVRDILLLDHLTLLDRHLGSNIALLVDHGCLLDRAVDLDRDFTQLAINLDAVEPFRVAFPTLDVQVQITLFGGRLVPPGDKVHSQLVVPAQIKGEDLGGFLERNDTIGSIGVVSESDRFEFGPGVTGGAAAFFLGVKDDVALHAAFEGQLHLAWSHDVFSCSFMILKVGTKKHSIEVSISGLTSKGE